MPGVHHTASTITAIITAIGASRMSQFQTPPGDRYFEDYVTGSVFEFGPIAVEKA